MRSTGPRAALTTVLLAGPAVAFLLGLAVALTGGVPIAWAASATLTATPTHGLVGAPFDAAYVSPVDPGTGGCGKGANLTWDGLHLAFSGPPLSFATGCGYTFSGLLPLAGHSAPGVHTLVVVQCTNFAPVTCTTANKTSTTYRVDTATVKVSPTSGFAPDTFTASYTLPKGDCAAYSTVKFFWGSASGAVLGSAAVNTKTCSASLAGIVPPAGSPPGLHVVTGLACIAGVGCDPVTTPSKPPKYMLRAPATITVQPPSGQVTASFTATYTVAATNCVWTFVRFSWDGALQSGWTTAMDQGTCSAALTSQPIDGALPGLHKVNAEACEPGTGATLVCRAWTTPLKPAIYTVEARVAGPSPSPSPSPSPTPSPSAVAVPSASPAASVSPPPAPAPTPLGGVAGATGSPDPWLPAFAATVPDPAHLILDPAVLATNAVLAMVFVLLFGLTAEILNGTLDEHRKIIEAWTDDVVKRRFRFLRPLARADAWVDGLAARGRGGAFAHGVVVLALLGVVYGFLSNGFGFNKGGLVLVLSMMAGLAVILYLNYGGKALLIGRLHRTPATVRAYGTAIVLGAVCVVASSWLNFHPGIVYGFVATTVVLAPLELTKREEARIVLAPAAAVLAASLIAWALLGLLRAATGDTDAFLPALAQTILGIVFIGGLESLLFGLLPIRFVDGAKVMGWSRRVWAAAYVVVVFLWWQLLFNRDEAYVDAFRQTGVVAVFAMLGFFMATTGAVWGYFRWRDGRTETVE